MAKDDGWNMKLVGIIVTLVMAAIVFMGNVVRGNDLENKKDHVVIRADITDFRVEQMRQGTILERIDGKL